MDLIFAQLTTNLKQVQDRIHAACDSAGRDPRSVTLVAVTKYVDTRVTASMARAMLSLGLPPILGESRPQLLWDKAADPLFQTSPLKKIAWHLIGHLQRNKVRRTVPVCSLIHSVDSKRLLEELQKSAATLQTSSGLMSDSQTRISVLLEVNCSGETQKTGLTPAEATTLYEEISAYPQIHVTGLMGMAARNSGTQVAEKNFAALYDLREQLRETYAENRTENRSDVSLKISSNTPPLQELSMGMSGDFETAIAHGATLLRIGSILFEGIPR